MRAQTLGQAIISDKEVAEWVRFACECNGVPDLVERISIRWSTRMTLAMGRVKRNYTGWEIALSVGLFNNATTEEQYNTIVHEACHAIDDYVNDGWCNIAGGHGPQWQRIMRNCGIEPTRYHDVSRKGLITRYVYACACGRRFNCSKIIHNKMRRGQSRICTSCKGDIEYTGEITDE